MVDQVSLWNSALAPPGVASQQGVKEAVLADPNRFFADTRPGFRVWGSSDHTTPTPSYLHDTEGTLRLWNQGGSHDREQQSFTIPKGAQFSKINRLALDASKNIRTDEGGVPQNGFGDIGIVPMKGGRIYPYMGYDPPISTKFQGLAAGPIRPAPINPEFQDAVPTPLPPPPAPPVLGPSPPYPGGIPPPYPGGLPPPPPNPMDADQPEDAMSELSSFLEEGGVGEDGTESKSSTQDVQFYDVSSVKLEENLDEDPWNFEEEKTPIKRITPEDEMEMKINLKWAEVDKKLDQLNKSDPRLSPEDQAAEVLNEVSKATKLNGKVIKAAKEAYERKQEPFVKKFEKGIVDSMVNNNEKISGSISQAKKKMMSGSRSAEELQFLKDMIDEQNLQLRDFQKKEGTWNREKYVLSQKQEGLMGEIQMLRKKIADLQGMEKKESEADLIMLERQLAEEKMKSGSLSEALQSERQRASITEQELGRSARLIQEQTDRIARLEDVYEKQMDLNRKTSQTLDRIRQERDALTEENKLSKLELQRLKEEAQQKQAAVNRLWGEKQENEKKLNELRSLQKNLDSAKRNTLQVLEENEQLKQQVIKAQEAAEKARELEQKALVSEGEVRAELIRKQREYEDAINETKEGLQILAETTRKNWETQKAKLEQEFSERERTILAEAEKRVQAEAEAAKRKADFKLYLRENAPENVSMIEALVNKLQVASTILEPLQYQESLIDISQFIVNQGIRVGRTAQSDVIAYSLLSSEFDYRNFPRNMTVSSVIQSMAAMIEQFRSQERIQDIRTVIPRFARMLIDLPRRGEIPAEAHEVIRAFTTRAAIVEDPFVLRSIALIISQLEDPAEDVTPQERTDQMNNVKRETPTDGVEMDEDVIFLKEVPAGTNAKQEPVYTDLTTAKTAERLPPIQRVSVMGPAMEEKEPVKNEALIDLMAPTAYFKFREQGIDYYAKLKMSEADPYRFQAIKEVTDPNTLLHLRYQLPQVGDRIRIQPPTYEYGYNFKDENIQDVPGPLAFQAGAVQTPPALQETGISTVPQLSSAGYDRNLILQDENKESHAEAVEAVNAVKRASRNKYNLKPVGPLRRSGRTRGTVQFDNPRESSLDRKKTVPVNVTAIKAGDKQAAYEGYKSMMTKTRQLGIVSEDEFIRLIGNQTGDLTGFLASLIRKQTGKQGLQFNWRE